MLVLTDFNRKFRKICTPGNPGVAVMSGLLDLDLDFTQARQMLLRCGVLYVVLA